MVCGAASRVFHVGLLVAGVAFAGHDDAHALRGAVAGPSLEHASVGVLERGGVPVCTASLIGPGWAITAGHCLHEQPRGFRMLAGHGGVLAVGRAHPSPDGGDVALLEIPEAATLRLPVLGLPAPLAACELEPRAVVAIGASHAGSGSLTSTSASAALNVEGECGPSRLGPMLLVPEGMPVALCPGDSGAPVVQRGGTGTPIHAVIVSQIMNQGTPGCGRDQLAIGFVESLRSEARVAWLARTAQPPRAPHIFGAALAGMPGSSVRVRLAAWQASPPPGARVSLVARSGRVWSTATVARSGAVTVQRPPPGTYQLRFTGAAGTRWSTPIRMG